MFIIVLIKEKFGHRDETYGHLQKIYMLYMTAWDFLWLKNRNRERGKPWTLIDFVLLRCVVLLGEPISIASIGK